MVTEPRSERRCEQCGATFWVTPSAVKTRATRFCSRACFFAAFGTPESRFWAKVDKQEMGCWVWTSPVMPTGYGQFYVNGRHTTAHRYSWQLHRGPIPAGLHVCHNCPGGDNPRCVNPAHLFLGTHAENMADMFAKGRGFVHTPPERRPRGDRHGSRTHPERLRRGVQQPKAKLDDDKVRAIRATFARGGIVQHELAQQYGVSQAVISKVILRQMWKHVR